MARPLTSLTLNVELQEILQTITRSREVPHSLVQRAQIILNRPGNTGDSVVCVKPPWMTPQAVDNTLFQIQPVAYSQSVPATGGY